MARFRFAQAERDGAMGKLNQRAVPGWHQRYASAIIEGLRSKVRIRPRGRPCSGDRSVTTGTDPPEPSRHPAAAGRSRRLGLNANIEPLAALYWCDGKRDLAEVIRLTELEMGPNDIDFVDYFRFLERKGYVEFVR